MNAVLVLNGIAKGSSQDNEQICNFDGGSGIDVLKSIGIKNDVAQRCQTLAQTKELRRLSGASESRKQVQALGLRKLDSVLQEPNRVFASRVGIHGLIKRGCGLER